MRHPAGDPGYAARLVEDAADHLPPRRGDLARSCHELGGLQEPAVEPERLEDQVRQRAPGVRLRVRLRPALARRYRGLDGHAAEACMRAGKQEASPRWKTPS